MKKETYKQLMIDNVIDAINEAKANNKKYLVFADIRGVQIADGCTNWPNYGGKIALRYLRSLGGELQTVAQSIYNGEITPKEKQEDKLHGSKRIIILQDLIL
jgi:hypothetical protein